MWVTGPEKISFACQIAAAAAVLTGEGGDAVTQPGETKARRQAKRKPETLIN
jgi:hypothetical protein